MTISLEKGGKVDLDKAAGGTLVEATVALGWNVRKTDGEPYDLDASIVGLKADGMSAGEKWFIFYGNKTAPAGVVVHHGDNLTGAGDGDDESITIKFAELPPEINKLVVAVTIYDARKRGNQTFALVEDAFVRIVDNTTGNELGRYDLTEDTGPSINCVVFGEFYRKGDGWTFKATGDGFKDELQGLVNAYKIA